MTSSKSPGLDGLKLNIQTHKSFDNTHLEAAKKLKASGFYPDRYEDNPFGTWKDTVLMPSNQIERNTGKKGDGTQGRAKSRVTGRSDKLPALDNNIHAHGFKMKHLPIPVREMEDGTYELLDGRGRDEVLEKYDVTNRVVDIYICNDQQADEFGIWANLESPISAPAKKMDVIAHLNRGIKYGWLKPDNEKWEILDLATVLKQVNKLAADGALTKNTRQEIALAVLNQNMTDIEVRSWTSEQAEKWLIANNYKNSAEVKYTVLACNQPTRALGQAASKYHEFLDQDDIEVRVIVHTGLLEGFDLERNYNTRVNSFRTAWEYQLNSVSHGFFGSKAPSTKRIKLWGACPAISTIHNMDKVIKFGKRPAIVDDVEENEYEEAA